MVQPRFQVSSSGMGIVDAHQQMYIPVIFKTRNAAQAICDELNEMYGDGLIAPVEPQTWMLIDEREGEK
jgi:hypothetical protein